MPNFNCSAINGSYDFGSFTLSDSTSDYDVKIHQAALFNNIITAGKVFIWSDQNISFRFNRTGLPLIPLDVGNGESPYEGKDIILVTNIFLTNASGSTANIKILLGT